MRSSNPMLREDTFSQPAEAGRRMTVAGAVNRTTILLLIVIATAAWSWQRALAGGFDSVAPFMWTSLLGGFALALITALAPHVAAFTGPLYAALKGLFLGGVSAYFEAHYPGIAMQAVALTFATMLALLLAYKSGLIQVTENFRLGVFAATGGIMLFYIAALVMRAFGYEMPLLHDSGLLGIAVSVFIVTVAALNLVLDFDFIESGEAAGAPKHMEWYAAFGLLVTLVWLYVEFLRLLAKLRAK